MTYKLVIQIGSTTQTQIIESDEELQLKDVYVSQLLKKKEQPKEEKKFKPTDSMPDFFKDIFKGF